jgi:hypothetical protein
MGRLLLSQLYMNRSIALTFIMLSQVAHAHESTTGNFWPDPYALERVQQVVEPLMPEDPEITAYRNDVQALDLKEVRFQERAMDAEQRNKCIREPLASVVTESGLKREVRQERLSRECRRAKAKLVLIDQRLAKLEDALREEKRAQASIRSLKGVLSGVEYLEISAKHILHDHRGTQAN